jgi:hypothetical protein
VSLFVNDQVFHKLLGATRLAIDMVDTDLCMGLLTFGDLTFSYTELGKQQLDVEQEV